MRTRRGMMAVALAGLAVGALAAPSIGRDREPVRAHAAGDGHRVVAHAATHDRRRSGPDYREYRATIAPHKEAGATLTCPRSAPNAVGGYFGTDSKDARGKLVMTNSNPVGTTGRKWDIGVVSVAAKRVRFYLGVTCMRNAPRR